MGFKSQNHRVVPGGAVGGVPGTCQGLQLVMSDWFHRSAGLVVKQIHVVCSMSTLGLNIVK